MGEQGTDNGAGAVAHDDGPASNLVSAYSRAVTPSGATAPLRLFNPSWTYTGSKLTGYTESVAQTRFTYAYDFNDRLRTAAATPGASATSPLLQNFNEVTSFNGWSNLATATDSVLNASSTWSYAAAGEAVTAIQHATGTSADGADGSIHAPGGP